MAIFLLAFEKLRSRLECHILGSKTGRLECHILGSRILFSCTPSIVEVLDMFVENMVASGDLWKCNSQELSHLWSSFSGVHYKFTPTSFSALIGYG